MDIKFDSTGTLEGFSATVNEVLNSNQVKTLLILSCDANGFTPENIDKKLKEFPIPVFGGIFPEIIFGKEKFEKGTIVAGLSQAACIHTIANLSDMDVDYEQVIDEKIPGVGNCKTMFVLVDGFAKRISGLLDSLFNIFGLEFNYIGGGAGSLSMVQKPCLFTNDGLIQDAAILALTELESGVGVSHGWQDVSGPYRVTESDRNTIKTLDWKPAFHVYKDVVEENSGLVFKDDNFFDIAKGFPFGISKLGAEKVVRDPFVVGEEDSLICVGEVPEGSYVHILKGDSSSLISAAKNALNLGEEAFKPEVKDKATFFIDCISRVLFLEDKFKDELNAVHKDDTPLIGALSIGEIANSGKDYLEFYNKTSVVCVLER